MMCEGPQPLFSGGQAAEERWPKEVLSHLSMAPQGIGKRPPSNKGARQRAPAMQKLRLVAGACQIPHPNKAESGGEDSYFIIPDGTGVGVADGVGEWDKLGVSTRPLADELMAGTHRAASSLGSQANAGEKAYRSLRTSFESLTKFGACTANVALMDSSG